MTKLRIIFLAFSCAVFSGCVAGRKNFVFTSEPSIERGMDILLETEEGREIYDFARENPMRVEYSNTAGLCNNYDLSEGTVYLPRPYRDDDFILALALAKGVFVYRMHRLSKFDDILAEMEEAAALFAARIALKLNMVPGDYSRDYAKPLKEELCVYITRAGDALRQSVRRRVLSQNADCGYPLETLKSQLMWLDKVRDAAGTSDLFQILNEKNMRKVARGSMTMTEAMNRDAAVRGLPTYDLYRYQRTFYETNYEIISSLSRAIESEIARDRRWREKNGPLLERVMMEFPSCQF